MRNLILIAISAACLSGCAGSLDVPMSPEFGRAVASMDAQIIQRPVSDQPPVGSGAVGVAAIGRYETGKVYTPETQNTSNLEVSGASAGKAAPAPGGK